MQSKTNTVHKKHWIGRRKIIWCSIAPQQTIKYWKHCMLIVKSSAVNIKGKKMTKLSAQMTEHTILFLLVEKVKPYFPCKCFITCPYRRISFAVLCRKKKISKRWTTQNYNDELKKTPSWSWIDVDFFLFPPKWKPSLFSFLLVFDVLFHV